MLSKLRALVRNYPHILWDLWLTDATVVDGLRKKGDSKNNHAEVMLRSFVGAKPVQDVKPWLCVTTTEAPTSNESQKPKLKMKVIRTTYIMVT